ncbi:MAG: hypothetical protein AAF581_04710 [Planctomycetota bacterium]
MRHSPTTMFLVAILFASPSLSRAQSLNINFGPSQLPATFGAAGVAGVWNTTPGTQGTTYSLVDLDGASTGVTLLNIGGSAINLQATGTTQAGFLLRQYLVTFMPTLEVCIFLDGMQNGTYRVITYAFLRNGPDSLVSVDQSTQPDALVGGPWGGVLELGLTHSIHEATVTNGSLDLHSGIPSGGLPAIAALNAVQVIRLPDDEPFRRGDANKDGALNIADAIQILQALFSGPVVDACPDASDVNDDGGNDIADPVALLAHLFGNGGPLPAPFATCDFDLTPDAASCDSFAPCP